MQYDDPEGYKRAIIQTDGDRSAIYRPGFFKQTGRTVRIVYFMPHYVTNKKTGEKTLLRGMREDVVAVKDITKCVLL